MTSVTAVTRAVKMNHSSLFLLTRDLSRCLSNRKEDFKNKASKDLLQVKVAGGRIRKHK